MVFIRETKSERGLHQRSRSKALNGAPQKLGVCKKVTTMKPKKPNSAQRKIAKVQLTTKRRVICYIPGRGHDLREYSQVLVRGGHVPDLPGVQYRLIRGKFDFFCKERDDVVERMTGRSKYGLPKFRKDAAK
jgi:small subunit ribosomal protein S12